MAIPAVSAVPHAPVSTASRSGFREASRNFFDTAWKVGLVAAAVAASLVYYFSVLTLPYAASYALGATLVLSLFSAVLPSEEDAAVVQEAPAPTTTSPVVHPTAAPTVASAVPPGIPATSRDVPVAPLPAVTNQSGKMFDPDFCRVAGSFLDTAWKVGLVFAAMFSSGVYLGVLATSFAIYYTIVGTLAVSLLAGIGTSAQIKFQHETDRIRGQVHNTVQEVQSTVQEVRSITDNAAVRIEQSSTVLTKAAEDAGTAAVRGATVGTVKSAARWLVSWFRN